MPETDPIFQRCEWAGRMIADRLWRLCPDGTLYWWVTHSESSIRFRFRGTPSSKFVYHDYIVSLYAAEAAASANNAFEIHGFVSHVAACIGVRPAPI